MSTELIRAPCIDGALPRRTVPLRTALFLDRDGVINVDHGYVHTPERTDWVPGVFGLVRNAIAKGMVPVVVTNQAGIGRGYYTRAQFDQYTRWMHQQFAQHGAPIAATYFCPHHPDAALPEFRRACSCRKPGAGMLRAAIAELALDPASSQLIGDNESDIEAARGVGISGLLHHGAHKDI